jgi:hypothetical protein
MAHTSRPERTRSLPNLDLKPRYKYFGVPPSFDLCWIRRLEEELDRLLQIRASAFDGIALARYIEFGTEPYVSIALAFNDRRKRLRLFHEYAFLFFSF